MNNNNNNNNNNNDIELDEDEDLYEGLDVDYLNTLDKKVIVPPKIEKREIKETPKSKYQKSKHSLYKRLNGSKTFYTIKEPCLFFGAPQINEEYYSNTKTEFLLLLQLQYFINDKIVKECCDNVGKVKRVVILEDEDNCKSLGICIVEFYELNNTQNYFLYINNKLNVESKKLDKPIEEQIRRDELYNYGGYIDISIIDKIKKIYLRNIIGTKVLNDGNFINKQICYSKHPIFNWFDTNYKDIINGYISEEIKKRKKNISNDFFMNNQSNLSSSSSESDVSTHIINYVSKKKNAKLLNQR